MPNQTTRKAADAFMARVSYKRISKNTEVWTNSLEDGSTFLNLHGSPIASIDSNGVLWITSAGWETHTTKERLNGIPGVSVYQHKFEWYLNGEKWEDSHYWTRIQ